MASQGRKGSPIIRPGRGKTKNGRSALQRFTHHVTGGVGGRRKPGPCALFAVQPAPASVGSKCNRWPTTKRRLVFMYAPRPAQGGGLIGLVGHLQLYLAPPSGVVSTFFTSIGGSGTALVRVAGRCVRWP